MAQDPSGSSLDKSEMEDEFQFLLCQSCSEETGCPKLLPCLHNVCPKCLLETKPLNCCPVCKALHSQTEATSVQDNLLFANLRAKLSVFQLIKSGEDLVCNNCKKEGVYWCSDCQEFLCNVCFESHQRYLKRENHEAKPVKDIKADSSEEFLTEFKNIAVMFCPNPEHRTQHLSIYCKACQLPMCCICTVLDPQHNGERCHIREEIQRRQQELLSMNMELQEKKTSYDQTCGNLRELVNNMVEAKNKTNERIQQRVAQIVQLVQEKGTQLLASVQEQHQRQVRDTEEKLHNVELVSQRMESCKLLVEKMHLYASDQEVMDMYPFIKQSLEELKRQEPPMVETPIQMENFSEVEAELEAFYERVTKKKEPAPVPTKVASSQDSVEKAPVKRKSVQVSSSAQTPTKHIKIEPNDDEWKQSTGQMDVAQPGTSSGDRQLASGDTVGKGGDTEINSENWFSILSSESLGSAGQVQLDQPGPSSGVGNGDSVWNGADTVIISDDWFPVSSADSSITDTSSCLNGGGHDESSNDIESMMMPETLVYSITLYYKPTLASNAVVIRTNPAEVPIECHYPRKSNVSSNAIRPTWIPFSSTLSAEQKLSFSLRLMNDDWSSERVSHGYQLGDVMNIQADVNGENHVALRLFVDSCVATLSPGRDSSPRYAIIDYHGCLVDGRGDSSSAFLPSRVKEDSLRFTVDVFRFTMDPRDLIYITCHLKVAAVDQAPDPVRKACSFNKGSNRWIPVEGTMDICSCCETRNCGAVGGQSGRLNPWGRRVGERRVRDAAASRDTQKKEAETDVMLGPIFISDVYMASRRSLGHQSQALEATEDQGIFSSPALIAGLALMSVAMVLALTLGVVLVARKCFRSP